MSKKDFIALADVIRRTFTLNTPEDYKTTGEVPREVAALADFCAGQNYRFNRSRWYGYIYGLNGPNGGAIK